VEVRIGQTWQDPTVTQVNFPGVGPSQVSDLVVIPDGQNTPISQSQSGGVREVGILGGQLTIVENEIRHGALANSGVVTN
jgi:hypothetical protein